MLSTVGYFEFGHITWEILLTIGLISTAYAFTLNKDSIKSETIVPAFILLLVMIWRIGCMPIPNIYSDRDLYAEHFFKIQFYGFEFNSEGSDQILGLITLFLSKFCTVDSYFILLACIYTGLYFSACRRMVGTSVFFLFLGCALCMGFTNYGTNTLRAGLAISFLLTGLSHYKRLWLMVVFIGLGVMTHFSMIIPASMILISRFFDKTKLYFRLWLLSIPVSFVAGGFFQSIFTSLSGDSRTSYLTTLNDNYNIGFRLDFIIYSLVPLLVGYYYIYRRNYKSRFYSNLYNAYILTNIFWILVIKANFSDRFAYLSWFMIPFILLYPILKEPTVVKKPALWLSLILLGETLFKIII